MSKVNDDKTKEIFDQIEKIQKEIELIRSRLDAIELEKFMNNYDIM